MLLVGILCFCGAISAASGRLSPDLEIYSLHVRSDIQLRFATTLVTSRVVNRANNSNEVEFSVTLPNEAFISNFSMEIGGVVYPGSVEGKAAAQKKFQKAKKKGKSTGLVSNWPPESNSFRVQVNVAALSKVTFNLTYQELLKRTLGVYQHRVFINPGQPVNDLRVMVAIQESRAITKLHVPPIQKQSHVNAISSDVNRVATISRPSPKSAFIVYAPTPEQQKLESAYGLSGHFVVEYDIERSLDAGDLLVVNGYFVHFLAPAINDPIPNDVLFILDMSGSMQGEKIRQLKQAMLEILEELGEGDSFNIIEFTGNTKLYKHTMVEATPKNIREATNYVNKLHASGWTDINQALLDGVELFRRSRSRSTNSPLLIFLTDGLPSDGVTNKQQILQNVLNKNEGGVPIFSLAFGKDADWDLVKTVAVQNDGFGRKIYEGSDAALQITGFYDEVAVTLVNDVKVKYIGDAVANDSITQTSFRNFFKGSEMVIAGKLDDPNTRSLNIEVLGDTADGNLVLSMDANEDAFNFDDVTGLMELSDIGEITEKLWAYLTIKQLMEDTVREMDKTARAEIKKRALELSLKYGFVTPLTSMVVVRPEDLEGDDEDEYTTTTTPAPTTTVYHTTRIYYRSYAGGGGGDPHYMIRIGGIEHPLCFDVRSKAGEIHNILTDPANGITVNTLVIGTGVLDQYGVEKTFIGQVSIQLAHHVIVVTPDGVFFDTKVFTWDREFIKHFGGSRFSFIDDGTTLSIQLRIGSEILIKRHVRHGNESSKVDYLNVYVKEEDHFSKRTTGLIGQFVNGHKRIILKKQHINEGGKTIGKFQIKERPLSSSQVPTPKAVRHVVRGSLVNRSEVIDKGTELCWMVHKQFEDILLGPSEHFVADEFIKQDVLGVQEK